MRDIKFKAWDEERKSMYCGDEIEARDDLNAWLSYGELCIYRISGHGDYTELERLQYTGLKDKNGVEIYEGDIIKGETITYTDSGHYGGMKETRGVVRFDYGRFLLENAESGARPDAATGLVYHEVIGNIYEHPHLLPQVIDANE